MHKSVGLTHVYSNTTIINKQIQSANNGAKIYTGRSPNQKKPQIKANKLEVNQNQGSGI